MVLLWKGCCMGFFGEGGGGDEDMVNVCWRAIKTGYFIGVRAGTVAGWVLGYLFKFAMVFCIAAFLAGGDFGRHFIATWKACSTPKTS